MRDKPLIAAVAFLCALPGACAGESTQEAYLAELTDEGLLGEFTAERAAVTQAEAVCEDLDSGGPAEGSEADRIAVEHYCDDYAEAFTVLENATVSFYYELYDADSADAGCHGQGGFGDINSSTAVVVRNTEGDELDRQRLGDGTAIGSACVWEMEFELTEGEETYIVSLASGRRGEIDFSWEDLRSGSAGISLGQ